jgi:transcriptional regulator with PAS, ATPase and Fis domain
VPFAALLQNTLKRISFFCYLVLWSLLTAGENGKKLPIAEISCQIRCALVECSTFGDPNTDRKSMLIQSPRPLHASETALEEFILEARSMRSIMKVVYQVAPFDVNVLISGESGTGKEVLARIIHLLSPRAPQPFVPINCGILSGLLFEDKLFGHEKGAFTGAVERKRGCFELAHCGTLFLDEVSELPFDNQVDFLRVLEDFRFARIGGSETIQVDVRLVSASNKDLQRLISEDRFREDLFYRLQVVPIHLPPLRERREAIPKMLDHFLERLVIKYRKPKPAFSAEVLDIFLRYEWPGNVRELKNLVERIFIVNEREMIRPDDLPSDFLWHLADPPSELALAEVRRDAETRAIVDVLHRTRGDKEGAARILKISARTLRHKIHTYGIRVGRDGAPLE